MTRPTRARLTALPLEDRLAPAVFTVTNTTDDADTTPAGSLRAALEAANANPGLDDIVFAIPGAGVHVIAPADILPRLEGAVRINGYSQPGASRNTLAVGDNAQILIQIDGGFFSAANDADMTGSVFEGLSLVGGPAFTFFAGTINDFTIRGNFINFNPDGTFAPGSAGQIYFAGTPNFKGGANIHIGGPDPGDRNVIDGNAGVRVYIDGPTTGLLVQNNYVGVNPAGTAAVVENDPDGIRIYSGIGGKLLDNVVSGTSVPISLTDGTEGFLIQGNKVGTDATGTNAIPNTYGGIRVKGNDHRIGGDTPGAANVIAFNVAGAGIDVGIYSTGVTISRNSIHSNEGLGITLNGGVTGVGNNGQPAPTLTSATRTAAGLAVAGTLTGAAANGTFTVEVFANPAGGDEGQTFLGTATVATDGSGNGSFTVTVPANPAGFDAITATATNTATGDTSEFSAAVMPGTNPPTVPPTVLPTAPPVLVGYPQFAAGADAGAGTVTLFNPDRSARFTLTPFGSFTGGVRTAAADFTGDGIADLVAGTGPGRATRVVILDGTDQRELFALDPFEPAFTGGVYVAAGDVTGDGVPDLVITPDEGGGPRVRVFDGKTFGQVIDFFGIDDAAFRGGARVAVGDVSGDGAGDLIVAAGFQGGPRVAGFNGKSLAGGSPARLFGDFFAFEPALRNGVYVAAGDLDGDGFAELIAGGGPGGGPRVTAFSGSALLGNVRSEVANFFAGDVNNRGGIRVAVKDLDGDTRADLVVGAGTGAGGRATAYLGTTIGPAGTPPVAFDFDAIGGFTGGVFVG